MNKDKKMLWKDIYQSIKKSKGRFLSIVGLMALGSFALVGLIVTGPDMRAAGETYFNKLNVADLSVVSDFGLDKTDRKIIDQVEGTTGIEYGYQQDVTVKNTDKSFRVFSLPEQISKVQVIKGRLPKNDNETAIDNENAGNYKIGDTIEFAEKEDITGEKTLKKDKYKVSGYIDSGEITSRINRGPSTAGSGELKGYAAVRPEAFDSDVYMVARMNFKDTAKLDPYSKAYTDKIQNHKDSLKKLLKDQPEIRMETIRNDYQKQIDDGHQQIADAKKKLEDTQNQLVDAKEQLENGKNQISENEEELNGKVAAAGGKIINGKNQISSAKSSLETAQDQLKKGKKQLNSGETSISESGDQLELVKQQLESAKVDLDRANSELQVAPETISQGKKQVETGYLQLAESQNQMSALQKRNALLGNELDKKKVEYNSQEEKVQKIQTEYDTLLAKSEQASRDLDAANKELSDADNNLKQQNSKKNEYETRRKTLQDQIDSEENLNEKEKLQTEYNQLDQEYQSFLTGAYAEAEKKQTNADAKVKKLESDVKTSKEITDSKHLELNRKKSDLQDASDALNKSNADLQASKTQINQVNEQIQAAKTGLAQSEEQLSQKEAEYQEGLKGYNQGIAAYNEGQKSYYEGLAAWKNAAESLNKKSAEYKKNEVRIRQADEDLKSKGADLSEAESQIDSEKESTQEQLSNARTELEDSEKEYEEKNREFEEKKPDAEQEIREQEEKLDEMQEILDSLKAPVYSLNSRRETPGAEGYKVYDNISRIVDSLAMVFPIFLYLVAALVTFTTMTRFVDEERMNMGTLKALGYDDSDVMKKFVFYGLCAGLTGAVLGIVLGHILMPLIVYDAYKVGFTLPKIKLRFYPGITLTALALALVSAVLPAWIVSAGELHHRPAGLLMPKPPAAGSKILLERIPSIWNRMNFTHKVTARNLFRYRKRMWMTIIGVAGAVSLLFAGFSVQYSIAGINEKQFGDLIRYDMIAASNDFVTDSQEEEIQKQLESDGVKQSTPIHYEELTKSAGKHKDTQEISLIIPEHADSIQNYVRLDNRKTGKKLKLPDDGVIVSERFARLLHVKAGDTIRVKDNENINREIKVRGISEMYMGHFMFTSREGYEKIFGNDFESNASLINLKDDSVKNTEKQAAQFMKLGGIKGVVQNTSMINQINTIVDALDKIMKVLIVIAALLGIVILYNLTNINVSERIRELSTIRVLGFYNKEVTMYIYRETILLTAFGILAGFGIGELLHRYIINVVPPDNVMFDPALSATPFVVPAAMITVITVLLGIFVNHKLQHVDMLEALKSNE